METVNMVHDLGMAAYSMGKYAITGEFEDFEMRSGIGKASEAGATSGELLTEMAVATVSAPVHLVEGLAEGDFEKVGENLVDTASIFMGRVKVPKISKAQKSVAKVAAKSKATPKIAAEARSGASNRAKPATKATTGDSGASKTQVAKRATRTTGKAKSTIDNAQTTARIMPEKRKAQSPDRRSENTASDGPSSCFVAGTLVRTREGLIPIEDIAVGDEVATAHEDTGERGWSTVTRTYQRQAADIFDLEVENQAGERETYGVTSEHPFWVVGKGWTPLAQLRLTDQLISRDGDVLRIVAKTKRQGSQTVYNLEVADTHTYHVGHHQTWVHNTCGDVRQRVEANIAASKKARPNRNFQNFVAGEKLINKRVEMNMLSKRKMRRNLAIAEVEMSGRKITLTAHSGEKSVPGTIAFPPMGKRKFKTFDAEDQPRHADSEVKIFEHLADNLDSNTSGKITLLSELKICGSCAGVIEQFQKFTNHRFEIEIYTGPNKNKPRFPK